MTKAEQLEEMLAVCRNLGAEVEYHPEYGHFTAMVWDAGPCLTTRRRPSLFRIRSIKGPLNTQAGVLSL